MIGPQHRRYLSLAGLAAALLFGHTLAAFSEAPPPPPKPQYGTLPPDARAPVFIVRALRQGTEIEFLGIIDVGASKELGQIFAANPQATVLHLNSPGGAAEEAHNMIALIRQRAMTTTVDKSCMSACPCVFLAGKERLLASGAELGFHRSSAFDLSPAESDAIQEPERRYLLSLSIAQAFVDKVFSTPASSVWIPSAAELKAAGIITAVSDKYRISVDESQTRWTDHFDSIERLLTALKNTDPDRYRSVHAHLVETMKEGLSESRISADLASELSDFMRRFISHASDALVLEYMGVLQNVLDSVKRQSVDACFFTLYPKFAPAGFDPMRLLTAAETKQAAEVLMKAALDGATRNLPSPSADQVAQAEAILASTLFMIDPRASKALSRAESPDADHAAVCKAQIDTFKALQAMPLDQHVSLARFIIAGGPEGTKPATGIVAAYLSRLHPDK